MSDNSMAFDSFVGEAGGGGGDEDLAASAKVAPLLPAAPPPTFAPATPLTFAQWMEASKHFDLHATPSQSERRDLYMRMQPTDCSVRRAIAREPIHAVVYGVVLAAVVGSVLGAAISASVANPTRIPFRAARATAAATARDTLPTLPTSHHRSATAPSRSQKTTIDKFLSFLLR